MNNSEGKTVFNNQTLESKLEDKEFDLKEELKSTYGSTTLLPEHLFETIDDFSRGMGIDHVEISYTLEHCYIYYGGLITLSVLKKMSEALNLKVCAYEYTSHLVNGSTCEYYIQMRKKRIKFSVMIGMSPFIDYVTKVCTTEEERANIPFDETIFNFFDLESPKINIKGVASHESAPNFGIDWDTVPEETGLKRDGSFTGSFAEFVDLIIQIKDSLCK